MNGLTVGRIVHYIDNDDEHRAAIVVYVWNKESGLVNLQVFNNGQYGDPYHAPEGAYLKTSVQYSEQPTTNTWHWVEKA